MKGKNRLQDERAPLFGSWTAWYWLVLLALVVSIGALYWFTKAFA